MARKSKKQRMKGISAFLGFVIICTIALAVVAVRRREFLTALDLVGWSLVPLTILAGFTWPTPCRVKTSRGTPCKGEAYGFLFGCSRYHHWWVKFLTRIGRRKDALKYVETHQQPGDYTVMHQPAPESGPIKVTIADNGLSVCGFWIGVASAVGTVIQVIFLFVKP
jgi:hypothetical protein